MNIINALANSIQIEEYHKVVDDGERRRSPDVFNDAKPIIQLNTFPVSIDPNQYKNARSSSNPGGDLRPLFAFRQLVDPLPQFGQQYYASASSTEDLYGIILNGANAMPNSGFTSMVIRDSKKNFSFETFPNMDGISGSWRPVYSVPEDWHSADDSRFKNLDIDLHNRKTNNSFGVISESKALDWILENNKKKAVSAATKINSIKMKYLLVGLKRPWFNPLLFKSDNWFLSGENAGFCSSGSNESNDGVFPLIPTSIILGKQIAVTASWGKEDQEIIDSHRADGKSLSLGPFSVTNSNDTLQIIGWISELIPFSPHKSQPSIT